MKALKKVTRIDGVATQRKQQKQMRIAVYCRVSTESDAQLESLEAQRKHYASYICTRDGWTLHDIYYERGVSAAKSKARPELRRMLRDCRLGKIDLVLTKSISRFSRNTADCLRMVRKLLELKIPVYFEKENINTSEMESELFLSILSSMAQDESASQSANVRWSIEQRFQSGTFIITCPPFGYRNDDGVMAIVEKQAVIVREIFQLALAGYGGYSIARILNDQNIPSAHGGLWSSGSILAILKNEKYTGDCLFQKTYTDDAFKRHKNNGEKNAYLVRDHHKAIIDRKTYDAVNELIELKRENKGIIQESPKYLNRTVLSGKVRCKACGSVMKRITRYTQSGSYKMYACSTHLHSKKNCPFKAVYEDGILCAFASMMNKLTFAREAILEPLLSEMQGQKPKTYVKELKVANEAIREDSDKLDVLTRLSASGYIDRPHFLNEKNKLVTRIEERKKEREQLKNQETGIDDTVRNLEALCRYVKGRKVSESFFDDEFKRFVDFIEVVNQTEICFVLKCGLRLPERMAKR